MIRHLLNVQTPDRWVDCDESRFREGGNPWTEIYTESVCNKIASETGIVGQVEIDSLRFQLAATGEYLSNQLGFVGGAAAPSKKRDWAISFDAILKKAIAQIDASDNHLSTTVSRVEGKRVRFYPASEIRKRLLRLRPELTELQSLIGAVEHTSEPIEGGTARAQTIQLVVDAFTEVFVDIVGSSMVKRVPYKNEIYGEFPTFIRGSAIPFLRVYYPEALSGERSAEKLNSQIQTAVEKYSQR